MMQQHFNSVCLVFVLIVLVYVLAFILVPYYKFHFKPSSFLVQDYLDPLLTDITPGPVEWDNWDSLMDVCSESNNITLVKAFRIMGSNPTSKILENEKCFIKCMGEGLNFVNPDGTLNETGVRMPHPYLSAEKVGDALERCGKIVGDNICDKAFKQSRCLFNLASTV